MKEITVVAGIIQKDGKILLAQRPTGDALAGLWEFPGGKVEPGETETAALGRELEEELGIMVAVQGQAGESRTLQKDRWIILKAYFCTLISGDPKAYFHQALRWVEPENLRNYPLAEADRPFLSRFDTSGS